MMNKRFIICILISFLGLAGCQKFLNQTPNSIIADENSWTSDEGVNAAVGDCYALIRSEMKAALAYYMYGDLPTDQFSTANDYWNSQVYNMEWQNGSRDWPMTVLRSYSNFYTSISQSTRCIHFIRDIPLTIFNGASDYEQQDRKNKYLGEAYFTRAFNYFYIARVWGDMPLDTTYISELAVAPKLSRSPQSEVLAQAVRDANMAKQYLGWQDASSDDRIVRADRGAAFALLAHIYAWEGKYDSCSLACDSVINSGSYRLADSAIYKSIYKGQSVEGIFEISANNKTESQYNASDSRTITGVTLVYPYLLDAGRTQPDWTINSTRFRNMFSDTMDVRYQSMFTKISFGNQNIYVCLKYNNLSQIGSTQNQFAMNNIIVFRYADILLLKAEAEASKTAPNPAKALELLNEVRTARKIKPLTSLTGPLLQTAISDERNRELFLEGTRFYDLIRLERLTGKQLFPHMTHSEFLAGKYYWPVDPSLFPINLKITQTPYWVGKIR